MSVCTLNDDLKEGNQMNTRERILAHSLNLFLKKGYTSVNISHILNDLNLSRGGFYHYFHSKEDLLKEVIEKYYLAQLDNITQIINSATSFESFICGIKNLIEHQVNLLIQLDERPNPYYLMFEAMKLFPDVKETISNLYIESMTNLRMFIQKCVESGEIKKEVEASMLSLQLITQIEGIYLLSFFADRDIQKDELLNVFDKIYTNAKYKN